MTVYCSCKGSNDLTQAPGPLLTLLLTPWEAIQYKHMENLKNLRFLKRLYRVFSVSSFDLPSSLGLNLL